MVVMRNYLQMFIACIVIITFLVISSIVITLIQEYVSIMVGAWVACLHC